MTHVKVIITTETAVPDLLIARVVWDDENPDYGLRCRTLTNPGINSKSPPAVVRWYPPQEDGSPPKKEKPGDFRVDLSNPYDWQPAIITVNGGGQAGYRRWQYLTGRARATYNKGSGESGWPMQMHVVFSGNLLIGEIVGDWFKFQTLKPGDLWKVAGMTHKNNAWCVHNFTCVGWDGRKKITKRIASTNTQHGQVYYFVVGESGTGYIALKHVKIQG